MSQDKFFKAKIPSMYFNLPSDSFTQNQNKEPSDSLQTSQPQMANNGIPNAAAMLDTGTEFLVKVLQWPESRVCYWLTSINMRRYNQLFYDNNINGEALLDCDTRVLKDIGVDSLGDRLKIYLAIKSLQDRCKIQSQVLQYGKDEQSIVSNRQTEIQTESENEGNSSPTNQLPVSKENAKPQMSISTYLANNRATIEKAPYSAQSVGSSRLEEGESSPPTTMSIQSDMVNRPCTVTFIALDGQTRKMTVDEGESVKSVLIRAMAKFGFQSSKNPYVYVISNSVPRRVSHSELKSFLSNKLSPERDRLILRIDKALPSKGEIFTSFEIEKGQALNSPQSANMPSARHLSLIKAFSRKGNLSSHQSLNAESNDKSRIKKFFGQRPPSEMISSNLSEYFPDQNREVLEKTVRNSIRFSRNLDPNMFRNSIISYNSTPLNINHNYSNDIRASRISGRNFHGIPPLPIVPDEQSEEDVNNFYTDHETNTPEIGPLEADVSRVKWIKGALIGSGSFGSVFLALNSVTGELMAAKQVEMANEGDKIDVNRRKAVIEAMQQEISLLKELSHPNIVQYLGSQTDETHMYIFLEYVPGGSVAALLSNYGPFEEPLIRNFVRQVLQGLNYLHQRKIVHCDIKGANILVDNKGGVKISDFGISRKIEKNLLSITDHRLSLKGSVYWMAPEVVKQLSSTSKADIWSLGCLIVEMFTGQHPYPKFSQVQALFRIGSLGAPEIPNEMTQAGKELLTKTFELDYHLRPSAAELLELPFLEAIAGVFLPI